MRILQSRSAHLQDLNFSNVSALTVDMIKGMKAGPAKAFLVNLISGLKNDENGLDSVDTPLSKIKRYLRFKFKAKMSCRISFFVL